MSDTWDLLSRLPPEERPWIHVVPDERHPGAYSCGGILIVNTHDAKSCRGPRCVIHNPTRHWMSWWPLHWRDDRLIFERICVHGIGHPDPDQWDHWAFAGRMDEQVHGCDRCCQPPASYRSLTPIDN